MAKTYLSFKKKVLLSLSAIIGFFLPFLGGQSSTNVVSADVPGVNQNQNQNPCPSPACCGV